MSWFLQISLLVAALAGLFRLGAGIIAHLRQPDRFDWLGKTK